MLEVAKQYLGKLCCIRTFNYDATKIGIVKEIAGNALILEGREMVAVNLEYIVTIEEMPQRALKKKGKKQG